MSAVGGWGGGVGFSSGIICSVDHFPARDDGELSPGDGGGRSLAEAARQADGGLLEKKVGRGMRWMRLCWLVNRTKIASG